MATSKLSIPLYESVLAIINVNPKATPDAIATVINVTKSSAVKMHEWAMLDVQPQKLESILGSIESTPVHPRTKKQPKGKGGYKRNLSTHETRWKLCEKVEDYLKRHNYSESVMKHSQIADFVGYTNGKCNLGGGTIQALLQSKGQWRPKFGPGGETNTDYVSSDKLRGLYHKAVDTNTELKIESYSSLIVL